jgi:hypothetical protein
MGHSSSREFSHSKIACENLFDCGWSCHKPLREATCRKKRLFFEKLRDGLTNITKRPVWSAFVIDREVALFKAPAPTLDHGETKSCFSNGSSKFSVNRFRFLPLQEEKFLFARVSRF